MNEYYRRKRRHLRAHLPKQQRDAWETLERQKKRALTHDEVKANFGWINARGQHVPPKI